ncbi:C-C motif chemokine 2-like, partial [Sinocyclocheilus rhinocerous]|uniref:C-C motif chemokine 2-like n=1 Tax=Sinocyclocheilus rhinocerous TaxID=307959 RepID=UPI0007B93B8A
IQGLDKCCFSFYNAKIPVKQIESYHTTHLECHRTGIIFITKAQREICADPTERWVQMAMNMVDLRASHLHTKPERKASGSVRTSETTPLHQPEETTLVLFKESHDQKASESVRMIETTPLHQRKEMCLVHFEESHD